MIKADQHHLSHRQWGQRLHSQPYRRGSGQNAHLNTRVFTDLSLITAVANDLCYEEVFAEPLRRVMKRGDMLRLLQNTS